MKPDKQDITPTIEIPVTQNDITQLQNITLFFFAYRDFTADADRLLKEIGFGRAHHRVLFFVSRKPGMTVAELLKILGITKQSLARVLRQMISKGYIIQKPGNSDRRQRLLYPTTTGREFVLELSRMQSRRIARAIEQSGLKNTELLSQFLSAMIDPKEFELMKNLISPSPRS
ncbi:MAG: winged helix-turn-helix transcriptional regulator [Hyphomicrobiales bacterium]|nr:winged helix-turn-helix transcriptional regulator [Hyphomicrobiales bacterium]